MIVTGQDRWNNSQWWLTDFWLCCLSEDWPLGDCTKWWWWWWCWGYLTSCAGGRADCFLPRRCGRCGDWGEVLTVTVLSCTDSLTPCYGTWSQNIHRYHHSYPIQHQVNLLSTNQSSRAEGRTNQSPCLAGNKICHQRVVPVVLSVEECQVSSETVTLIRLLSPPIRSSASTHAPRQR